MKNKEHAKQMLKCFHYDPWNMMGPRHKLLRQNVIIAITGEKRPMAKCGVTEIQKLLREHINTSAATCAAREPEVFKAYFEN
jgi:hypothetical protein